MARLTHLTTAAVYAHADVFLYYVSVLEQTLQLFRVPAYVRLRRNVQRYREFLRARQKEESWLLGCSARRTGNIQSSLPSAMSSLPKEQHCGLFEGRLRPRKEGRKMSSWRRPIRASDSTPIDRPVASRRTHREGGQLKKEKNSHTPTSAATLNACLPVFADCLSCGK